MKKDGEKQESFKKGPWEPGEDLLLTRYIETHGEGKWTDVSKRSGLNRGGKSCRLRWMNYLRPNLKHGRMSHEEEDLILRMHKLLGNRWSLIAGRLPGRTDNEVKNYWNTNLRKRKLQSESMGSNSKKKNFPESPESQPASAHIPCNSINVLDKGSHIQSTDAIKRGPCDIKYPWLSGDTTFFEDPFSPSLDLIMLKSFEQGMESWTECFNSFTADNTQF